MRTAWPSDGFLAYTGLVQYRHFLALARICSEHCGQLFIAGPGGGGGAGFIAILLIMYTQKEMITKSMTVLRKTP